MVSFAFNTMIGQVTPIAIERIGYRFYILFIVCNFTNAIFFCKHTSSPKSSAFDANILAQGPSNPRLLSVLSRR